MRLCVVSSKECWRDASGRWWSSGGFPLQMEAVTSLFDEATMLITEVAPREGGLPLPARARVVGLRRPTGHDLRRKISLAARFPYYWGAIWREISAADVVHTPLPGDLPALGLAAAVLRRRRVLARYGGSWQDNAQSTPWGRRIRRWMRRLAGGRNVMLATGEGAQPPAPGMHWIFSTALSSRELEAHRPDLDRVPDSPARLAFVGRLSPEKGGSVLLEALEGLAASGLETKAVFAGDGPERGRLEAQARQRGLNGRVRFAGQLDRARLRELLDASDLCVQPSLTEGFSKAWLDALSAGLPVVASDVGAAAAVLGKDGERGWRVPPGDAGALQKTLLAVLRDARDWPALRRRCRAYVEGRTLESWARRIGEICSGQWGVPFDGRRLG